MIEPKYRIKDEEDFERIFTKFAKNYGEELGDNTIIEGNNDITYGAIKVTCKLVGYENILLPVETIESIERGEETHVDTFYIDILGLNKLNIDLMPYGCADILGGAIPDELGIEADGTLRLWYD